MVSKRNRRCSINKFNIKRLRSKASRYITIYMEINLPSGHLSGRFTFAKGRLIRKNRRYQADDHDQAQKQGQ